MMRPSRRFGTSSRTMIAAAALAPWLIGCAPGSDPDALSGSSQAAPIVSSATAEYGDYGASEPGTNWGRADAFHTQCLGGCRTLAGGS
jgi:hypothetical protein